MKNQGKSRGNSLRKKAEKFLFQQHKQTGIPPVENPRNLIHELQVYQIELEMQNEELRRQQAESDEAKDRYRDLYDFAPVGYFTFDPDGQIEEANLTGATLLGLPRSQLIGKSFSAFVERDCLPLFRTHLRDAFASNVRQTCELNIRQKRDKSSTNVSVESIAVGKDGEIRCRSAIMGINERKQMEEDRKRTVSVAQARFRIANSITLSVDEILQKALDEIESQTGSVIGFYHFLEIDQETLSLQNWSTNTIRNMCTAEGKGSHYPISQAGVWVDCVRERRPVIHNDFASLPHRKGMPPGHASVSRELIVPVLRGGQIVAIIGVGNKLTDYDTTDIEIASLLGDLSWEIVERKRAEQVIEQSEKRYRSYIEVTLQLGWVTNAFGEVVEDLPSWRRFTGQGEEEVKGWGWSKALHPDDFEHTTRLWRNAVATKSNYEAEYRIRRYDGEYRHFLARGIPVFKADGNILEWVGTCIDITERKRAEEALKRNALELRQLNETLDQRVRERTAELSKANESLRQLSMRILSAQEDERKRIAGELHDTIGSWLTGIKFKVEDALGHIGKSSGGATEALNAVIPFVKEGIEECRRIQMDLRPPMLDDLGLLATLSWFCRRFQTIYSKIQVEQKIGIEEGDVPLPLKLVIFRVTQEAMNNIAKYSKADLARLILRKKDNRMELIIQDNGRGFDIEKARHLNGDKRGLGLSNMKERTELSGGSFNIKSAEGKGTIVRASWPLGDSCQS
jgi:PAS domain S-box-containing protein